MLYDVADTLSLPANAADRLACAVEFWHLASLLLDDLPCMDDAHERRGQPCLHITHGEHITILTSLALINRAYTLVGEAFASCKKLTRQRANALVDTAIGPQGIVGGQAQDLTFANSPQTARQIACIALRKTGSLLWLCVALPATWAQTTASESLQLRRLSVYWSLGYQAIDDLNDVLGTKQQTGKTGNRDRSLCRPNLALCIGAADTLTRVKSWSAKSLSTVQQLAREREAWACLSRWHETLFIPTLSRPRAA